MASARVLRAFYDRDARMARSVGDTFVATDERLSEIEAALARKVSATESDGMEARRRRLEYWHNGNVKLEKAHGLVR